MILSIALGFAMLSTGNDVKGLVCPMTAEEVNSSSQTIDFAGTRFAMCCGGCPDMFKRDPSAAIKSEKLVGKTFGVFLFDPVSNKRIDDKAAKGGTSDYKGTRYLFANMAEKEKFDANPKLFVKAPTKEVLYCAVAGEAIKNYAAAGGFVDVADTRYYMCCPDCLAKFKANPSEFTAKVTAKVSKPAAMDSPK